MVWVIFVNLFWDFSLSIGGSRVGGVSCYIFGLNYTCFADLDLDNYHRNLFLSIRYGLSIKFCMVHTLGSLCNNREAACAVLFLNNYEDCTIRVIYTNLRTFSFFLSISFIFYVTLCKISLFSMMFILFGMYLSKKHINIINVSRY